jgi:hypothetical protein
MDLFGPALGALTARNLLILWLRGPDLTSDLLGYQSSSQRNLSELRGQR